MRTLKFFLVIWTSVIIPWILTAPAASWVTTVLDKPPIQNWQHATQGLSSSMGLDAAGNVHIVHVDHTDENVDLLRHVTNATGAWVAENVDVSSIGIHRPDIATDATGNIHIVYGLKGDNNLDTLVYATNRSGNWQTTPIYTDNGDFDILIQHTSIALDAAGSIHIAFAVSHLASDNFIKYSTDKTPSWSTTDIGTKRTYMGCDIAADTFGKAHVVYWRKAGDALTYANNTSGEWISETIDQDCEAVSASVVVDSSGHVHVAYADWHRGIKYFNNVSGSNIIEVVDPYDTWWSNGGRASLALDSTGKVHIAYTDVSEQGISKLRYADNTTGIWETEPVDPDPAKNYKGIGISAGPSIAISIDAAGDVHMAYRCSYGNEGYTLLDHRLKYTTNKAPSRNISGNWGFTTTDNWFAGVFGCTGDSDETGSGTITQNGSNVTAVFNGNSFTGSAAGDVYELYATFPEANGGTTRMLSYLTATDGDSGVGEILWFWDNSVHTCNGGNQIAYHPPGQDVNQGANNTSGGGGGGCFVNAITK